MANNWFSEKFHANMTISLKINKTLHTEQSAFQHIEFVETTCLGKALILDGAIQTTVGDEFVYHEAITLTPLCAHANPCEVLIIGGGDGGVLREAVRHPQVRHATLVELDQRIIELAQQYLPEISQQAFADDKAIVKIEDGAKFVKENTTAYDVIIIDSPDPIGPAKVLFASEFYRDVQSTMKKGGIMVRQSGSTFLQRDVIQDQYHKIRDIFRYVAVYTAAIPTYVGGLYSFIFASDTVNPCVFDLQTLIAKYAALPGSTKYYNPQLHLASFQLPNYLRECLVQ